MFTPRIRITAHYYTHCQTFCYVWITDYEQRVLDRYRKATKISYGNIPMLMVMATLDVTRSPQNAQRAQKCSEIEP